jgi:hypothetical protein
VLPAFLTAYVEPVNGDYVGYFQELRRARFLESVADELNRVLVLPAPVTLRLAECGRSTTTWVPEARLITVCYEFLDAVVVIAGEAGNSPTQADRLLSGAITFALFGEVGTALVGIYGLPAAGGALQAGDEFAALTLAAVDHGGESAASEAIEFFDAALGMPDSGLEYLETHGFDRARLETVACIVYGAAPATHPYVLERGLVTPARAPRCLDDAAALAKAWDTNLREHAHAAEPAVTSAAAPAPAPAPAAAAAAAPPAAAGAAPTPKP